MTKQRRYKNRKRAEAKAAGLCSTCWVRPVDPSYLSCGVCRVRGNAASRKSETGVTPEQWIAAYERQGGALISLVMVKMPTQTTTTRRAGFEVSYAEPAILVSDI